MNTVLGRRLRIGAAVLLCASVAATGIVPSAAAAKRKKKSIEVEVERVTVESFDGTELGGWLLKPAGATGPLPSVLISSPYLGQCVKLSSLARGPCWPTPETREDRARHPEPVDLLVEAGYAVGWFSVRGTGVSGGCWEDMGKGERLDQKALVEWLASRTWSNGRVGAMGISYMSSTALGAAVTRPQALKTVVVGGVVGDLYGFFHSPQGLSTFSNTIASETAYGSDLTLVPVGSLNGDPALTAENAEAYSTHLCPGVVDPMTQGFKGGVTGDRDEAFWLERRLSDDYDRIDASVLIAHGFQDSWGAYHSMQEDTMWERLRTEKGMLLGQWGHTWPWDSDGVGDPGREDLKEMWHRTLLEWLDHYLKDGGRGPKPSIEGKVVYEDDSGEWHTAPGWPLAKRFEETLYLTGSGLDPALPVERSTSVFRSYPQLDRGVSMEAFACPSAFDPAGNGSLVLAGPAVSERTVLAGNPRALLDLSSDQPGGGFQVTLFDVAPDYSCSPDGSTAGIRALTTGGADLRFLDGNFSPIPFEDRKVRVDLANLATVLPKGHRLVMSISHPRVVDFNEFLHAPVIGVHSAPKVDSSQLVIQAVEGGFGGTPSKARFPRRPF